MKEYLNVVIEKHPELLGYFEKAKCIDVNFFNEEKILAFDAAYHILSIENKACVLEALKLISNDEMCRDICKLMFYFMQEDLPIEHLTPPDDGSLQSEFLLFFPLWYMAEEFAQDAERRGISREVLRASLGGIDSCITRNSDFSGKRGTSAYHTWLPLYAQGKLFLLGDFQYERRLYNGKEAIGIHIPKGTILQVEKNLRSFYDAMHFFEKYYNKMEGLVCESWLLNPNIEEILGRKTNISRFGDMFERFDIGDTEGNSVYRFVFGLLKPADPDTLCADTSLQRKLKEYLKAGNKLINYGGFLSEERLREMLCNVM